MKRNQVTELETSVELEKVESKKRGFSKGIVALAGMALMANAAFAAAPGGGTGAKSFGDNSDSFGDLLGIMIKWMQGNLGKFLALVGFAGTFIIYLMTHKGSVLFIGVIISIIAGGLIGIVATFFSAGDKAFQIR